MRRFMAILIGGCMAALLAGCGTPNPSAYSYMPGQPSANIRNAEWEGFGTPSRTQEGPRTTRNLVELEDNPRVLWVIADTYGNPNEMDPEWVTTPWFFNPARLRFIQPVGSPADLQHWHGFGCYSRGWPLLYRMPNVDVVLFRMIDVADGEVALLDFLDGELVKYKGRIIVSNSWGVPRQYNQWDSVIATMWQPWANRIDQMAVDYPAFAAVFSAGNSGPDFSGFPQSLMTNAVLVGASDKLGKMASFSSQDHRMFCVAGGHRTYVADPDKKGGYMIVSGTSFSCPTVAAMMVKLLAENPTWGRTETVAFLEDQIVPSPESNGFNPVWGQGELEHFNQTVPSQTWRDLGYPKGVGARIRGWFTPMRIIEMPQPVPRIRSN